jgi:serine/threonine protein kinase
MSTPVRPIIFGKYCLLERISVGGMAEVFRARPFNAPGFKRFLAVKRILPNLAEDEQFISMFVDEAKISVQLNHKRVCQIYELGRLQDSFYIVMEFIAGKNLLQIQNHLRAQKKMMSVTQAAFIALGICEGLDYAHRKVSDDGQPLNIIHRDISPQNILVSYDGEVKVIDFGIARAATKNKQTQVGVLKGKFGYMSPEQAQGGDIDHRSDIFAVGALLWEMLTSRRLFHGKTDFQTLDLVRTGEIEPASARNSRVPPEIDRILARALERDVSHRYQWASEFADDLRAFLAGIKPGFTEKSLSQWMCGNFVDDLEYEKSKLPVFAPFVTVQDVIRLNHEAAEDLHLDEHDEIDELEEDDATRVVDVVDRPVKKVRKEFVLAENEAEPMATVVMNLDEIRLPDAPVDLALLDDGASPRVTASMPVTVLTPGIRKQKSATSLVLRALAAALVVALVALLVTWMRPTTATLRIASEPSIGVLVSVNGVTQSGSPPLVIEDIPPGEVLVTLSHPDYVPVTERATVQAGGTLAIERRLAPLPREATIQLTLDSADAQVYLDGELLPGSGTQREFAAASGAPHSVEVYRPGFFVETYQFSLRPSEAFNRDIVLRPVTASLTLRSVPAGTLFVNGEEKGSTTDWFTVDSLDVDRTYEIEIRPDAPGYRPFTQTLVFDTYYQPRNSVVLRRIGDNSAEVVTEWGNLSTGAADRWYRVFVDGRDTGLVTPITPERPLPLKAGERTIRFVRANDERSVTVQVVNGQTLHVDIPPG